VIIRQSSLSTQLWIVQRTGMELTSGQKTLEAVREDGSIAGQIAFCAFTPGSAQVHIALDVQAALRPLLREACRYVFEQAKRNKVIGVIPEYNKASLRLAKHVGLRETYRIRDGYDVGCDIVILEMTRDECRWLAPRKAAA